MGSFETSATEKSAFAPQFNDRHIPAYDALHESDFLRPPGVPEATKDGPGQADNPSKPGLTPYDNLRDDSPSKPWPTPDQNEHSELNANHHPAKLPGRDDVCVRPAGPDSYNFGTLQNGLEQTFPTASVASGMAKILPDLSIHSLERH